MLFVIAGIGLLFARNVGFQELIEKEERKIIDDRLSNNYNNSKNHAAILDEDPDNKEERELEQLNTEMVDYLYEIRAVEKEDWQTKLRLENEYLLTAKEYKDEGGDYRVTYEEISYSLALNEKLLEENIPPEHDTFSLAMPNFMKVIVNFYITFGAFIIIIILIGEMMSGEFETNSINLLFTQPMKRTDIITSKFFSAIIIYVLTTVIILVATALIGGIFGENGTFNYPMVIQKNNSLVYITIAEYMTQSIVVVSVTVLLIIVLYLLYSLLFKHTLGTLFVMLATLLGGYGLTWFIPWSGFAWINPFQYLLPQEVILVQNNQLWSQGIPITILVSLILLALSLQKIKTSMID